MTNLVDYRKSLEEHDVPVLGYLAWYSVKQDVEIAHQNFAALVATNAAPIPIPKAPHASDVFKRACTAAELKKIPSSNPDNYYNFMVKNSGSDATAIWHVIVKEIVDTNSHVLSSETIGRVVFNKHTYKTRSEFIHHDPSMLHYYDLMTDQVTNYIQDNQSLMTAYGIRESIRRGLLNIHATSARPGGGVYFVSKERYEDIVAMFNTITPIAGATFHFLPLVDDKLQRSMIREAFESETMDEASQVIAELTDLLAKDKLTAKKFTEIQVRFSDMKSKLKTYQEILSSGLSKADSAIQLAEAQILGVLEKVEL